MVSANYLQTVCKRLPRRYKQQCRSCIYRGLRLKVQRYQVARIIKVKSTPFVHNCRWHATERAIKLTTIPLYFKFVGLVINQLMITTTITDNQSTCPFHLETITWNQQNINTTHFPLKIQVYADLLSTILKKVFLTTDSH